MRNNTLLWACKRVCRCWCKSSSIEIPSSSVSRTVLLLSLILSLDWFTLSTDIDNRSLCSAETCTMSHTTQYKKIFAKLFNSKKQACMSIKTGLMVRKRFQNFENFELLPSSRSTKCGFGLTSHWSCPVMFRLVCLIYSKIFYTWM